MSEPSGGRPILRKRGARKRDKKTDKEATPTTSTGQADVVDSTTPAAKGVADEPGPRLSLSGPHAGRQNRTSRVVRGGVVRRRDSAASASGTTPRRPTPRRLYEPEPKPSSSTTDSDGESAAATPRPGRRSVRGNVPSSGNRPERKPRPQPAQRAKLELKDQAQALAKDKSIPLVHAYRILKGQTNLNDVLKAMMRKERFDVLVNKEGIDRELAGQVVSGHLPKERAVVLTRMRALREEKLHIDAIKAAEIGKVPVAIDVFGKGWQVGLVTTARPYDFDFVVDGQEASETLFKHDVKALCTADDLGEITKATEWEATIKSQELVGTEDRGQRVRPEDDWMLGLIEQGRTVRFTMRDGELFLAKIRSFGRWDVEIVLPGGETALLFFHALHPVAHNLGLSK